MAKVSLNVQIENHGSYTVEIEKIGKYWEPVKTLGVGVEHKLEELPIPHQRLVWRAIANFERK